MENKERFFGSGNGELKAKMTARLVAASNPVWGTHTMDKLANFLDTSFLSRLIIWYQDEEHVHFIQDKKGKKERGIWINSEFIISIIDFCVQQRSIYDYERVKKLCKDVHIILTEQEEGWNRVVMMYDARYEHHAHCLIDGIIKFRCISNHITNFVAEEQDYAVLNKLWLHMINQWGIAARYGDTTIV